MDVIALLLILGFVLWLQMRILCRFVFYRIEYSASSAYLKRMKGYHNTGGDRLQRQTAAITLAQVDIHTSRWLDFAGTCSVIARENRHDQQLRTEELSENHAQMEAEMPQKRGVPY